MAETTNDIAGTAAAAADTSDATVAPATTFSTSGAPVQTSTEIDLDHPAVDNNPRANTTDRMNAIDFNDPRPAHVVQAEAAQAKSKS